VEDRSGRDEDGPPAWTGEVASNEWRLGHSWEQAASAAVWAGRCNQEERVVSEKEGGSTRHQKMEGGGGCRRRREQGGRSREGVGENRVRTLVRPTKRRMVDG
jgi:hypothetical protein